MKRLIVFLSLLIVAYAIYYDIKEGTLPEAIEVNGTARTLETEEKAYFEKEVEHGETVLSIVEAYLDGPIPVSIEQLIHDFEKLNDGTEAGHILIGESYKFPKYSSGN